ncbi:hypothetical protein J2S46_007967 [Kitasatospora herbaricolor]|nr:hypothetical protein [Kitasatospora herbaricolor]
MTFDCFAGGWGGWDSECSGCIDPPPATDQASHQARESRQDLLRELLPEPSPHGSDGSLDAVLQRARANWLPAYLLHEHVEAWIPEACGAQRCVDALVGLLKSQPVSFQLDPGLRWVRELTAPLGDMPVSPGFLMPEWLEDLRPLLNPTTWPSWTPLPKQDTRSPAGCSSRTNSHHPCRASQCLRLRPATL